MPGRDARNSRGMVQFLGQTSRRAMRVRPDAARHRERRVKLAFLLLSLGLLATAAASVWREIQTW